MELLSPDVVFRSPVACKPYQGREAVAPILRAVWLVFEHFRYVREIGSQDGAHHALVFHARVGDQQIEGCDFLQVDDHGSIDELVVMVRPGSAEPVGLSPRRCAGRWSGARRRRERPPRACVPVVG